MNFNGLDQDEFKNLLNDRKIILGEQTKTRIKEDYSNNAAQFLNRVTIKKSNDIFPDDLLPKSSNSIFEQSLPKVNKLVDRMPTFDIVKPINYVERPEFTLPINSNLELEKMREVEENPITENDLVSFSSTKIEKKPKSILKKIVPTDKEVEIKNNDLRIDIEKLVTSLKKYNINISRDELLGRLRIKNVDTLVKLKSSIGEIVNEFKPKKLIKNVEIVKVFNEKDYYRDKVRICVNSSERDLIKFPEPNNFEVILPKDGLRNVCLVRLISLIMPKSLSFYIESHPFIILDVKELGQNFIMNNGKVGGFCQIIFEKENSQFMMAYPDISQSKELSPIRNIDKLSIRLLKPDGEIIQLSQQFSKLDESFKIEESIKLEIEKPKINLPDYNPDPNFEVKKIEEIETKEIQVSSDKYLPISFLFEFTYLKIR